MKPCRTGFAERFPARFFMAAMAIMIAAASVTPLWAQALDLKPPQEQNQTLSPNQGPGPNPIPSQTPNGSQGVSPNEPSNPDTDGAPENSPLPDAVSTLRVRVNLVNMFFTVRDPQGNLVKHLTAESFRVTDNGVVQKIKNYSSSSDQPLALAIVVDQSGSVKEHIDFERKATADFIRAMVRPGKDQAALIVFDKKPRIAVGLTSNADALAAGLDGMRAEGGTALYDAARMGLEQLNGVGPERKVLVLVTDGEDTVSWTTERDVMSLALSHNVIVYTLGVKADAPGSNESRSRRHLRRISEETGGLALFPRERTEELKELFARMEEELRFQYSLAYSLPPPDGSIFHRVEIETQPAKFDIRTRRGYYSTAVKLNPVPAEALP